MLERLNGFFVPLELAVCGQGIGGRRCTGWGCWGPVTQFGENEDVPLPCGALEPRVRRHPSWTQRAVLYRTGDELVPQRPLYRLA